MSISKANFPTICEALSVVWSKSLSLPEPNKKNQGTLQLLRVRNWADEESVKEKDFQISPDGSFMY